MPRPLITKTSRRMSLPILPLPRRRNSFSSTKRSYAVVRPGGLFWTSRLISWAAPPHGVLKVNFYGAWCNKGGLGFCIRDWLGSTVIAGAAASDASSAIVAEVLAADYSKGHRGASSYSLDGAYSFGGGLGHCDHLARRRVWISYARPQAGTCFLVYSGWCYYSKGPFDPRDANSLADQLAGRTTMEIVFGVRTSSASVMMKLDMEILIGKVGS